jgi:hypothetical protein
MNPGGIRYQDEDRVVGADPLAGYGTRAAEQLRRLESFPHSGDNVVNGAFDASTGLVVTFEEMVGTHGGLGGPQTDAFLLHPAAWPMPPEAISNPEALFQVLVRWRDMLLDGTEPRGSRVDAPGRDAL